MLIRENVKVQGNRGRIVLNNGKVVRLYEGDKRFSSYKDEVEISYDIVEGDEKNVLIYTVGKNVDGNGIFIGYVTRNGAHVPVYGAIR